MWQDRTEVKKGDLGEGLVDAYLLKNNIIPYHPVFDGAHPFDRLIATPDKKSLAIVDVKTKARRTYYPDTGIDNRHLKDYLFISNQHNLRVFLFFVDEFEKRIYGNYLDVLMEPRVINHNGKQINYPLNYHEITYFPLESMKNVSSLTDKESSDLKQLSQRSYDYQRTDKRSS